jgi:hypothetical protein
MEERPIVPSPSAAAIEPQVSPADAPSEESTTMPKQAKRSPKKTQRPPKKTQLSRSFLHSAAADHVAAAVAAATFTQRGTTANFVVSFAGSLGASGPVLADAVLATCEADFNRLQGWFGNIAIADLPFQVFIQPGRNGASHATCAATALSCDAFDGTDADLVRSLVVAEADEVFMANQAAGWDCGGSNGEALSRVLAAEIYPNELMPPGLGVTFASAEFWLESDRPDFVNNTDPTDRNFVSIGCGALFINFLRFQLGYGLDQIVQAAGATLGETYQTLTGQTDGFEQLSSLLATQYPPGQGPYGLSNDNPFPI